MKDRYKLLLFVAVFLFLYFVPFSGTRVPAAILEAFFMLKDYAREHVLFCLVPALFIAGAITIFVSKEAVVKYFGAKANKVLAYGVASVSGTILAVCSCTVLPVFAGILSRGAGIGPATAFLYSGPAINVLAIILTARILGPEIGIARAVGAISFSIVIGLAMAFFFKDKKAGAGELGELPPEVKNRTLAQTAVYFGALVFILIFAAWARPKYPVGFWSFVYSIHWYLVLALLVLLAYILVKWFNREELKDWMLSTWIFAKQIFPLLLAGVLVAGFLLGRPNTDAGVIPSRFVALLVGGNSIAANFFASVFGAFMYFATLTEVPILQGLLGSGMGKGPALALLLSGPALSLPSMLILLSIMGWKKTTAYVLLVIVLSTIAGWLFGALF